MICYSYINKETKDKYNERFSKGRYVMEKIKTEIITKVAIAILIVGTIICSMGLTIVAVNSYNNELFGTESYKVEVGGIER